MNPTSAKAVAIKWNIDGQRGVSGSVILNYLKLSLIRSKHNRCNVAFKLKLPCSGPGNQYIFFYYVRMIIKIKINFIS